MNESENCVQFLRSVFGEVDPSSELHSLVGDGILLCRLVNLVQPGAVPHIDMRDAPFCHGANVEQFVDFCRGLGIPGQYLPPPLSVVGNDPRAMKDLVSCLMIVSKTQGIGTWERMNIQHLDLSAVRVVDREAAPLAPAAQKEPEPEEVQALVTKQAEPQFQHAVHAAEALARECDRTNPPKHAPKEKQAKQPKPEAHAKKAKSDQAMPATLPATQAQPQPPQPAPPPKSLKLRNNDNIQEMDTAAHRRPPQARQTAKRPKSGSADERGSAPSVARQADLPQPAQPPADTHDRPLVFRMENDEHGTGAAASDAASDGVGGTVGGTLPTMTPEQLTLQRTELEYRQLGLRIPNPLLPTYPCTVAVTGDAGVGKLTFCMRLCMNLSVFCREDVPDRLQRAYLYEVNGREANVNLRLVVTNDAKMIEECNISFLCFAMDNARSFASARRELRALNKLGIDVFLCGLKSDADSGQVTPEQINALVAEERGIQQSFSFRRISAHMGYGFGQLLNSIPFVNQE